MNELVLPQPRPLIESLQADVALERPLLVRHLVALELVGIRVALAAPLALVGVRIGVRFDMPAQGVLGGVVLLAQLALISHTFSRLGHGLGIDALHNETRRRIVDLAEMDGHKYKRKLMHAC